MSDGLVAILLLPTVGDLIFTQSFSARRFGARTTLLYVHPASTGYSDDFATNTFLWMTHFSTLKNNRKFSMLHAQVYNLI